MGNQPASTNLNLVQLSPDPNHPRLRHYQSGSQCLLGRQIQLQDNLTSQSLTHKARNRFSKYIYPIFGYQSTHIDSICSTQQNFILTCVKPSSTLTQMIRLRKINTNSFIAQQIVQVIDRLCLAVRDLSINGQRVPKVQTDSCFMTQEGICLLDPSISGFQWSRGSYLAPQQILDAKNERNDGLEICLFGIGMIGLQMVNLQRQIRQVYHKQKGRQIDLELLYRFPGQISNPRLKNRLITLLSRQPLIRKTIFSIIDKQGKYSRIDFKNTSKNKDSKVSLIKQNRNKDDSSSNRATSKSHIVHNSGIPVTRINKENQENIFFQSNKAIVQQNNTFGPSFQTKKSQQLPPSANIYFYKEDISRQPLYSNPALRPHNNQQNLIFQPPKKFEPSLKANSVPFQPKISFQKYQSQQINSQNSNPSVNLNIPTFIEQQSKQNMIINIKPPQHPIVSLCTPRKTLNQSFMNRKKLISTIKQVTESGSSCMDKDEFIRSQMINSFEKSLQKSKQTVRMSKQGRHSLREENMVSNDNFVDGFGRIYYPSGRLAYQGTWCNNQFHGKGRVFNDEPQMINTPINFADFRFVGDQWISYEGDLVHDRKEGWGCLTFSNGQRFQGNFVDDVMQGHGKFFRMYGPPVLGLWQGSVLQTK